LLFCGHITNTNEFILYTFNVAAMRIIIWIW